MFELTYSQFLLGIRRMRQQGLCERAIAFDFGKREFWCAPYSFYWGDGFEDDVPLEVLVNGPIPHNDNVF